MREIIIVSNVEVTVEDQVLFKADHLGVKEGEVIGIVGKNGAGKTTLLNLLNGQGSYEGSITNQMDSQGLYVKQEVETYEAPSTTAFQNRKLNRQWQGQAGFDQLSGGEKLKKRLLNALNQKSRLLFLDEPTNHLDEESVEQLIAELKQYRGTIVLVSHDRYFLDQIATTIWAIEDKTVKAYQGNYSSYVDQREHQRETQRREFTKQQKEIKRVTNEMQKLSHWSVSSHAQSTKKGEGAIGAKEYYRLAAKRMDSQRKSIQKRLEADLAKETVERVKDDYRVQFSLEASKLKKGPLYLAEGVAKSFDGRTLFEKGEFTIMFGERVAITGANGSGKTTLLKMLLGTELYEGEIWQSEFADIGYLSQEVYDLPNELRVSEFFEMDRDRLGKAMTLFVHLGFQIEQWESSISELSMGERVKIKLMSHIMTEKNVLILDEPTNHLDIPAREELERVLEGYQGTLIFVSHDRYFREKVASRTLDIYQGQIVAASEKVVEAPPVDRLLLEFQRDELLSKLSTLPSGSQEYEAASQAFEQVLGQLKKK